MIGKVCEVIFEVIEVLSGQGMFSIHKGMIKGSVHLVKWKFIFYPIIAGLLGVMFTYMLDGFTVDWPSFIGIFIGVSISQFIFMFWRKDDNSYSDRK